MSTGPIANSYWVEPGRFAAGEYPGTSGDTETRLRLRQILGAGIRLFLDLTEAGELTPYDTLLREEAAAAGIEVRRQRLPIRDVSIPTPAQMRRIQDVIAGALAEGIPLYLHCWGGVGRTGTVVACYFVASGLSGREALQRLRGLWQFVAKKDRRPRTPETTEQERFVLEWKPGGPP